MTIGPEPITSTELRSVRLGILVVSSCGGGVGVGSSGLSGTGLGSTGPPVGGGQRVGAGELCAAAVGGDEFDEPVEQVGGVMRAGGGLGVVLDAERRNVQAAQPLDHRVVEAGVAHLDPAVAGLGSSEALPYRCIDGE